MDGQDRHFLDPDAASGSIAANVSRNGVGASHSRLNLFLACTKNHWRGSASFRQDQTLAQRTPLPAVIVDALRHAVPLVQFYGFQGSLGRYILLTAFDLGMALVFIVGSTRERGDVNSVDPRSRWLPLQFLSVIVIAPFLAIMAAIIAIPVGMPAYVFGLHAGLDWPGTLLTPLLWVQVSGMSLLAATRYQVLFYHRTSAGARGQPTNTGPVIGDLEGDRRRSLADKAAQTTLLVTFAALCYGLIVFGGAALYALPAIYSAILVFYDARPDIGQRIFPALWQQT